MNTQTEAAKPHEPAGLREAREWLAWWDAGGYASDAGGDAIEAIDHLRAVLAATPDEPVAGLLREALTTLLEDALMAANEDRPHWANGVRYAVRVIEDAALATPASLDEAVEALTRIAATMHRYDAGDQCRAIATEALARLREPYDKEPDR